MCACVHAVTGTVVSKGPHKTAKERPPKNGRSRTAAQKDRPTMCSLRFFVLLGLDAPAADG